MSTPFFFMVATLLGECISVDEQLCVFVCETQMVMVVQDMIQMDEVLSAIAPQKAKEARQQLLDVILPRTKDAYLQFVQKGYDLNRIDVRCAKSK